MPSFEDAYEALPVVFLLDGAPVRWLGPLVDAGHDGWMGDLSAAAYGTLEECGWMDAAASGPAFLEGGRLCRTWSEALADAAGSLAAEGSYSGPEGSVERWASWLVFHWSALHRLARPMAENGQQAEVILGDDEE